MARALGRNPSSGVLVGWQSNRHPPCPSQARCYVIVPCRRRHVNEPRPTVLTGASLWLFRRFSLPASCRLRWEALGQPAPDCPVRGVAMAAPPRGRYTRPSTQARHAGEQDGPSGLPASTSISQAREIVASSSTVKRARLVLEPEAVLAPPDRL
jgi:hypothetical protein